LAAYTAPLKPVHLELDPALRRRIKKRARLKKSVTLRVEVDQIAAAKPIALRKSVPCQTLIQMWISEALVRELGSKRGCGYCPLPAGAQFSTVTR
jgi:hypothetical protein